MLMLMLMPIIRKHVCIERKKKMLLISIVKKS